MSLEVAWNGFSALSFFRVFLEVILSFGGFKWLTYVYVFPVIAESTLKIEF